MKKGHFGGTLLKNSHAKTARPLSGRSRMQLVLKIRKENAFVFTGSKAKNVVLKTVQNLARKNKISVKELSYDRKQLYLTVVLSRQKRYAPFIRALTGALALRLSGANKFAALQESFWACRPWSCILDILRFSYFEKQMLQSHLSSIGMAGRNQSLPRTLALGP